MNKEMTVIDEFLGRSGAYDRDLAHMVTLLWTRHRNCGSETENIFERASSHDLHTIKQNLPCIVNNRQNLDWPLVSDHFTSTKSLPIRAFRSDPARTWTSVDKLRIFLSSGTSSSPEGRSRSCFSVEGLHFYRAGIITAFLEVLRTRAPSFSAKFLDIPILSLIPPATVWTDSSLAQMVAWIAEFWQTTYPSQDLDHVSSMAKSIKLKQDAGQPFIVFGTAFHFVNLLDAGYKFNLPRGSIVIETGGTKGKSRAVTREELYHAIRDGFNLDMSAIISEYGMCEIATPAWDIVPWNTSLTLADRAFKFPWWVRAGVMTDTESASSVGQGLLLIEDPLRVDLPGHAIQTEDLAMFGSPNKFRILGRVPKSPLKGCSLRAEDILPSHSAVTRSKISESQLESVSMSVLRQRAATARKWFETILSDPVSSRLLTTEFHQDSLAKITIDDLNNSVPHDIDTLVHAALTAVGFTNFHQNCYRYPQNWLFIAPSSHSIALIQPLLVAMILNMKIRIRLPNIGNIPFDRTFLAHCVESMRNFDYTPTVLSQNWRLGPNDLLDNEYILAFGDDETCRFFNLYAPNRASTFGHTVSLSVTSDKSIHHFETWREIWIDQAHLHQRGCLSSRMIFVIGGSASEISRFFENYLAPSSTHFPSRYSVGELAAHDLETVRYRQLSYQVASGYDPLGNRAQIVTRALTLDELPRALTNELSELDILVPVFVLPPETQLGELVRDLCKIIPLKSLALDEDVVKAFGDSRNSLRLPVNLQLVSHGNLGKPPFNGLHLSRPFFVPGFGKDS